jgi:RHS repeat-associated protein
MRELATETDSTGTTDFTYYQDGTQDSETDPGQNPQTDNTPDPQAGQPQTTTLPDGTTQSETYDDQGNLISQSGDGQLAATYGYDENGTGQMTSLTTSTGTTHWAYDPTTGQLQSETFADGTKDTYAYNDKDQLAAETLPGVTGTFGYDAAGDQLRSSYFDATTGLVQSVVAQQDDQGRAIATVDTDNGQTYTETDAYTSLGDLQSETFGSAGNTSVNYAYYPVNPTGTPNPNASPDALESMTASTPGGQSVSQTYTYDPSSKRLESITVNGVMLIYGYDNNSNQIGGISAEALDSGENLNVSETFFPDSADGSRLGEISVDTTSDAGHGNTNQQTVYDASYTYNDDNQRATDVVTQTDSAGNTTSQTLNYTYDPTQADALTQVTDGNGNVLYNYGYDGVGNRSGTGYGTANSVNEYSNITYNQRGDETDDGSEHFAWDAEDRLIGEAPDHPGDGSTEEQMGYDTQGRMLWQTVDTYDATTSAYDLTYTHKFVWNGQDLVAELDANNTLIENFTWGPGAAGSDTLLAITDDTLSTPKTEMAIEDASGSVEELVNPSTGQVDASYTYGPFGENFTASGPEANLSPFGFQMMMRDPSGKWYDHARWYDADQGRFISEDPTGINGGLNIDAFANNDPINKGDQTGTQVEEVDEEGGENYEEGKLREEQERERQTWEAVHPETPEEEAGRQTAEAMKWRWGGAEPTDPYQPLESSTIPPELLNAKNADLISDVIDAMWKGLITPEEAVGTFREIQAGRAAEATPGVGRILGPPSPGVNTAGTAEPSPGPNGPVLRPNMQQRVVAGTPIFGTAQNTKSGDETELENLHAQTMMEQAEAAATTGKYRYIVMNRSVWTASNRTITGNLRPDLIMVRNDGKIDLVEVVSSSQSDQEMQQKLDGIAQTIPELLRGTTKTFPLSRK